MKALLTLLFAATLLSARGADLNPNEKRDFVAFYRSWRKLLEEFPTKPEVIALFTDLNADGTPEAIATSFGERYEDGNIWSVFLRSGNSWIPANLKMIDETTVDLASNIFARNDEFYSFTSSDGAPRLLIIHKHYDRMLEGGKAPPLNSKMSITNEGFVLTEKLPSLDQIIAYSRDFKALERLRVEVFKD